MSNRAVKVKNENWTVHVHGDMTVMNKDEAAKLSAIFRNDKPPRRRRATERFLVRIFNVPRLNLLFLEASSDLTTLNRL